LTYNEAFRQKALLEIKEILRTRGITDNTLHAEKVGLNAILINPQSKILKEALEQGDVIRGIKLCGFAGILNYETQSRITFAQEFSGRIKVIACIDKKPNLLHSDDPYRYEMVDDDWRMIKEAMEFKSTDVALVVWGNEEDTSTALNEIKLRAIEATRGVPSETRQAFSNGTTDFERILPGPDRMYPDTDSEPTPISKGLIKEIRKKLPERLWNRESRYKKLGLPSELYKPLSMSPLASLFDRIVKELALDPKFVAFIFVCTFKNIARTWFDPFVIDEKKIFEVFKSLKNEYLNKEIASFIFRRLSAHPDSNVVELLEDAKKANK
jgi:glutamyl-tRNA(Gln) amidotransferase subunit E